MARAKQASKRKRSKTALPVWGAAGCLWRWRAAHRPPLCDGEKTTPQPTLPVITLGEEELSDVTLSKFFVFDREAPLRRSSACNTPNGAAAVAAAAAEAAPSPADAAAVMRRRPMRRCRCGGGCAWFAVAASASLRGVAPAAAAAAACRGEPASSARPERFPIALTDAARQVDQTGEPRLSAARLSANCATPTHQATPIRPLAVGLRRAR